MSRLLGYAELLGRLLCAIEDTKELDAACEQSVPDVEPRLPSGPHGTVLANLGHRDADLAGARRGVFPERVYPVLGYVLTTRARVLAQVVEEAYAQGAPDAVCLDEGVCHAQLCPQEPGDRKLGDLTVLASVRHLAARHGAETRTSVEVGYRPPLSSTDGHGPVSLLGHACSLWGLEPAELGVWAGCGAVEVLGRLGWTVSPRAAALLIAIQVCEAQGHPWGDIAEMAATLHATAEPATEVDQ